MRQLSYHMISAQRFNKRSEQGAILLKVVVISACVLAMVMAIRSRISQQTEELNLIKYNGLRDMAVRYISAQTNCAYSLNNSSCSGPHALYDRNNTRFLNAGGSLAVGPFSVSAVCEGVPPKLFLMIKGRIFATPQKRPLCDSVP